MLCSLERPVGDDSDMEDAPKLTDLAMNESFPSDEPNDSDGEREGETKTNNFEDVPPGALCDSEFVIIKLKVEGKARHKFFVAITVSKDPLTVNFMKRLSKSTFTFPENDDAHEVRAERS